jgi:hypothetical protein
VPTSNENAFTVEVKVAGKENRTSVKKVVGYNGYQRTFKMFEPEGRERVENEFNGVDKIRLQVAEGPG